MAFIFIALAVFVRIIPHISALDHLPYLPNFTPIAAVALFSGFYLNKKYSLLVALLAMLVSDLIIGFYSPSVMASVYSSFILIGLLGMWLRKHKNAGNLLMVTVFSSALFYLVTNFAVWAFPGSFMMYPKTWQGLMECYIMGLPFLRNTAMGDLFYVGAFFGAYELVKIAARRSKFWQTSKI